MDWKKSKYKSKTRRPIICPILVINPDSSIQKRKSSQLHGSHHPQVRKVHVKEVPLFFTS